MFITTILLTYALLHGWMFLDSLRWGAGRGVSLLFLRLMLVAMAYDNVLLAIGPWCVGDAVYAAANYPRFIAHAGLLPFLTLFALEQLRRQKVALAQRRGFVIACVLFVGVCLAYGFVMDVARLEQVPATFAGHSRLVSAAKIPPIATIVTNLVVIPMAFTVWRRGGTPWFVLGAVFILLVNGATGAMPWGFVTGNMAELVFIAAMLVAERTSPNEAERVQSAAEAAGGSL